jgi:hypothetical protein
MTTTATDTGASDTMPNEPSSIVDISINERTFGIRAADVEERRNSASMLINKMYAWRGYGNSHTIASDPNKITLTASDNGEVIGTVSLGLDAPVGLLADQVFKDYIDVYRERGSKVCEIIKLAIDPSIKSKSVLASLFHVLFLYARDLHGCTEIFIEVNPRHRRFYETMLGFTLICESRPNPRVDAPAVLLHASIAYITGQVVKLGGNSHNPGLDRSLYPYVFSQKEEAGILNRLRQIG